IEFDLENTFGTSGRWRFEGRVAGASDLRDVGRARIEIEGIGGDVNIRTDDPHAVARRDIESRITARDIRQKDGRWAKAAAIDNGRIATTPNNDVTRIERSTGFNSKGCRTIKANV